MVVGLPAPAQRPTSFRTSSLPRCHQQFSEMGAGLLTSIDPVKIQSEKVTGLALKQVALLGNCLIQAIPETVESCQTFIKQNFNLLSIYVDVRKLKSWIDVVDFLNVGAKKVFVTFEQLKVLIQEPTISADRLVLTISLAN